MTFPTFHQLTLTNFKNFRQAELPIGPFTLLIGANAAGKSNLRDAFRLLQGTGRGYTLPEIIGEKRTSSGHKIWDGIRGGVTELVYQSTPATPSTTIQIHLRLAQQQLNYLLEIGQTTGLPIIHHETLTLNGNPVFEPNAKPNGGSSQPETKPALTHLIQPHSKTRVLIESLIKAFQGIRFLEFKPDLMRQPSPPGQTTITDNGDNLSSVLHTIYNIPEKRASLLSWLAELTPMDVVDLDFFRDEIGQVRVQLVEGNGRKISAFSASDGTLRFLAILATFLSPESATLYFFEELETGIHPARQYLLLQFIEEQIRQTAGQIVATTHSPALLEMLQPAWLKHAVLVYRLAGQAEGHILPLAQIPQLTRLATQQGLGRLFTSGWFENTLSFLQDNEL